MVGRGLRQIHQRGVGFQPGTPPSHSENTVTTINVSVAFSLLEDGFRQHFVNNRDASELRF